ncbi:hypothetical protein OEZ85_012882 [Tetradesmus obliquus]|uniref:Uncharacterized protein n=1 Tax=Tetradesmus obliquus TaxID=3088 RepID=A0ABY8U4I9_TETOB|nr:hypothetical protein OEZ85_012882 [Tetradesmus obliquus]
MSEINGGVQGQQACAVYSEAAWLPGISSTSDFRQRASYGVKASPAQDAACFVHSSSSSSSQPASTPFKPWQRGSTALPSFCTNATLPALSGPSRLKP